jgi:hypothetical protein
VARNGLLRRDRGARDRIEDTQDLAVQMSPYERTPTDPWPGGFYPAESAGTVYGRVRVSLWAALGLILSLIALCATLTGLLALEGFGLGVLGILASIAGLVAASGPRVTGHGLASVGLLAGLAATGLAVAALTGHLSWLDGHTDAVPRWHAWLVNHWPWLRRW